MRYVFSRLLLFEATFSAARITRGAWPSTTKRSAASRASYAAIA